MLQMACTKFGLNNVKGAKIETRYRQVTDRQTDRQTFIFIGFLPRHYGAFRFGWSWKRLRTPNMKRCHVGHDRFHISGSTHAISHILEVLILAGASL